MGQDYIFTKEQKIILDEIGKSIFIKSNFYFTGGTALSSVYLNHRVSDDLDIFSEKKFNNQAILQLMEEWGLKHKFTFNSRFREVVYIFDLIFDDKTELKVDFGYYPYKRVEKSLVWNGIEV